MQSSHVLEKKHQFVSWYFVLKQSDHRLLFLHHRKDEYVINAVGKRTPGLVAIQVQNGFLVGGGVVNGLVYSGRQISGTQMCFTLVGVPFSNNNSRKKSFIHVKGYYSTVIKCFDNW